MSTSTRVTRSKGESDGLSLSTRTRPTTKETISGRNGGTALNTTFNVGRDQQQQMPTQMPQLPTQSSQANSVGRTETPALMLPPGPHRPLTPRMPLPASPASSSQPSRSSDSLFKEDKYSSTSEEETEVDTEITFIHGRNSPTGCLRITQQLRDQRPHQRLWITLPRVIQTHHLQPQICSGRLLQMSNFWARTIFSFQMAATGAYTRSITKFFMQVTWRMATTHISWSYLH